MEAGFLCLYLFAGSHSNHVVKKHLRKICKAGSIHHGAAVKVNPVLLFLA